MLRIIVTLSPKSLNRVPAASIAAAVAGLRNDSQLARRSSGDRETVDPGRAELHGAHDGIRQRGQAEAGLDFRRVHIPGDDDRRVRNDRRDPDLEALSVPRRGGKPEEAVRDMKAAREGGY